MLAYKNVDNCICERKMNAFPAVPVAGTVSIRRKGKGTPDIDTIFHSQKDTSTA